MEREQGLGRVKKGRGEEGKGGGKEMMGSGRESRVCPPDPASRSASV